MCGVNLGFQNYSLHGCQIPWMMCRDKGDRISVDNISLVLKDGWITATCLVFICFVIDRLVAIMLLLVFDMEMISFTFLCGLQ